MTGKDLPKIATLLPGPRSRELAKRLRRVESPNVTYVGQSFPIFWHRARGANVEDVDGNCFIDLTSAFGVQGAGHGHHRIVQAVCEQAGEISHGMGDVHPTEIKVKLAERLAELAPGDLSQVIFSSSGSEAVESAFKTASMFTGKPGIIAFEGAYHGLTYGALAATHRPDFRTPFLKQLGKFVQHIPFPDPYHYPGKNENELLAGCFERIETSLRSTQVGGVIVEPIQGRGGIIIPPIGFLGKLKQLCRRYRALLIADEIMTGFGRTGAWFACDEEGVVPDILVLGKGMTGGFPISACMSTPDIMASWGESSGEAIHTSTFMGSPLGAAFALATLSVLEGEHLIERSRQLGASFISRLKAEAVHHPLIGHVRGRGLMIGVELVLDGDPLKPASSEACTLVNDLLNDGIMVLPCGPAHNVLSITPPFVITKEQLEYALGCFIRRLQALEPSCAGASV